MVVVGHLGRKMAPFSEIPEVGFDLWPLWISHEAPRREIEESEYIASLRSKRRWETSPISYSMPSYKYYITSLLSSYAVSTDTLLMFIERRRRRALVRGVLAKCIGLWVIVPTLRSEEAVPEVVYSARGCIESRLSLLNIKQTRYGQHLWISLHTRKEPNQKPSSFKQKRPQTLIQTLKVMMDWLFLTFRCCWIQCWVQNTKSSLDWKTKGHHKKGDKTCFFLDQKKICTDVQQVMYNVTCSIDASASFLLSLRLKCQRLTKEPWCYFQASSTASCVAKGSSESDARRILHKHKVFSLLVPFCCSVLPIHRVQK